MYADATLCATGYKMREQLRQRLFIFLRAAAPLRPTRWGQHNNAATRHLTRAALDSRIAMTIDVAGTWLRRHS